MISDIFNIYQKNIFVTALFQTLLPLPWYVILLECMLTKQVATKRWTGERVLKAKLFCRTDPWNWRWLSIETRKLFGWRWTWFAGKDLEGTICFFSFDWESSVENKITFVTSSRLKSDYERENMIRECLWMLHIKLTTSGKRVGITLPHSLVWFINP